MSKIKLPHASGNSMSIAAPATNPASDLELKLPATIGSANQLLKNSGTAGELEFSANIVADSSAITFKAPDGGNRYYFGEMGNSASAELSLYDSSDSQKCKISADSSQNSFFNSGGNVGIGISSPVASDAAYNGASLHLHQTNSSSAGSQIHLTTGASGAAAGDGSILAQWSDNDLYINNREDGGINFFANGSERVRIESNGNLTTLGADFSSRTQAGFTARKDDSVSITRLTGTPVEVNRQNNDGGLIQFYQGNSSEGNISVSGSTVSYNGGHLSRWSQIKGLSQTDKSERPTIYQGTVMSNLDDLCEWEGEENQQLNMTKISDVDGDKNVAGVFWAWDDDDDTIVNDFYVAMTGDMVIRVAASTTVARGDLLISAGDGTAKPQADDIVRSGTIAKIISTNSTATYADGSKAYPCVLMAC